MAVDIWFSLRFSEFEICFVIFLQPPGASSRCLDCPVERDCIYSAKTIYLDSVKMVGYDVTY